MMAEKKQFATAIIVITTVSAAIMELIDVSIVNVALADISGNLGATIEDTSWVVTAYAIANVIVIPMTGFLASYFGRKNYYITSIVIFTLASFACGNSGNLWELVFWRFIQGIGGGALLSTSQGILFDSFEISKRPMASGIFGMGIVLGPTIGPTLGGVIVENYSWPLIFYINIPIGITAVFLSYRYVEKKPEEFQIDRSKFHIDYSGVVLLALGVGSLQYVLERGQIDDWFDSRSIVLFTGLAAIGLIGFVMRELTATFPIIDLRVLKSRNLVASNLLTFVVGFGLFGSVFIFPVMVQRILGYSPTEAGYALVPGALTAIVIMPIIGKTLGKTIPPLVFVVLGFFFFILHGYTSSLANPEAGRTWFILPQILRGAGTAFLTVPLINQAIMGLGPKQMPYAISLTNMLRQLGGAFGIATMNIYITQRYSLHRSDLLSNLQADNPLLQERLNGLQQLGMNKGYDQYSTIDFSYKLLDGTLTQQAYLLSYLDGFKIISLFFLCCIPLMFLLKTEKTDAAMGSKISEELH
jgi:MFS transporter, DHA2 family, multidrug resistance protein